MINKVVLDWETLPIEKDHDGYYRHGVSHHEVIMNQSGEVIAEVWTYNDRFSVPSKLHKWQLSNEFGGPYMSRRGKCPTLSGCKEVVENFLDICGMKRAPKRANVFA